MKIIKNLEEARPYKRGWTYILLSKNKRVMKIGRAIPNLKRRIYQHLHCRYYKLYDFQFLLAIDDAKYEEKLHSYFESYRCRYLWLDGENSGQHYTEKEAKHLACKLFKKNQISYDSIISAFDQNTIITRNEIFAIPPRKVGSKLEKIIVQNILN